MILHVASTAPVAVRVLADLALGLHIGGGAAGLTAGTVTMIARKGGRLHRLAGLTFVFAMLTMAGVGAVVAPMIDDIGSAVAGAIVFYMVLTGWQAGRKAEIRGGLFEKIAVAGLLTAVAAMLWLARQAAAHSNPALADVPWYAFYVIAGLAGLLAALELKVILGRPLIGPPRLARHVWRMGLGFFGALMSALAQPKVGGVLFHGPTLNLQWIPVGALVIAVGYWLVRVRRGPLGRPRKPRPARPTAAPARA